MQHPTNQSVLDERIRLLYDHLPFVLSGNLIASVGLAFMVWGRGHDSSVLAWVAAVFLLSGLRWLNYRYFVNHRGALNSQRWAHWATAQAGISGCIWGTVGILFFQHEPVVVAMLIVVYAGMTSGSVSSHSTYLPTYLAYAIPTVAPFALNCLWVGEGFYTVVGALSLAFLLVNIYYGRNIQRALLESIRLRFENDALIEELTHQKEMAEQANAAKTKFLAAASHDLRQPSQALELFIDALDHQLKDGTARVLIEKIRSSRRALVTLLNALLDYSKIDAAAIHPAPCDFPLGILWNRLRIDYEPQAAARGLRLRVAETTQWGHSDPSLLERILRNFIENALKYTEHGSVLLGCRSAGDQLRIEVHDTGIGIPLHLQTEIFREFYQLDNPERDRERGLGLGLAIADSLARLLGHPLHLRSEPGRGSIFSITLPKGRPRVAVQPTAAAEADDLNDKTVLLIDDDAAVREAMTNLLEAWSCCCVAVESAAEAVDLMDASGFRPDAILVDYRLRAGATGVQAIHAVEAYCGRHIPAAIVTGDTAPDRLKEADASGFPLLHKPLTGPALRSLLGELLASSQTAA